jgi:hypothetical protein
LFDTDGDSIPDARDECPNESGTIPGTNTPTTNGCAYRDSDQDGIEDRDDACPKEPNGPEDNDPKHHGCPPRSLALYLLANGQSLALDTLTGRKKFSANFGQIKFMTGGFFPATAVSVTVALSASSAEAAGIAQPRIFSKRFLTANLHRDAPSHGGGYPIGSASFFPSAADQRKLRKLKKATITVVIVGEFADGLKRKLTYTGHVLRASGFYKTVFRLAGTAGEEG